MWWCQLLVTWQVWLVTLQHPCRHLGRSTQMHSPTLCQLCGNKSLKCILKGCKTLMCVSTVQLSDQIFARSAVKCPPLCVLKCQRMKKQSTRAALKHIGIFRFQVQRNKHDILAWGFHATEKLGRIEEREGQGGREEEKKERKKEGHVLIQHKVPVHRRQWE